MADNVAYKLRTDKVAKRGFEGDKVKIVSRSTDKNKEHLADRLTSINRRNNSDDDRVGTVATITAKVHIDCWMPGCPTRCDEGLRCGGGFSFVCTLSDVALLFISRHTLVWISPRSSKAVLQCQ